MILPIPVKTGDLWPRVEEFLAVVNQSHSISLEKLITILPNMDQFSIEELTRKRGPLELHGNGTFTNDGVKVSFDLLGIKTPIGTKDFTFYIDGQLNGIFSLNENELKLTFDKDYSIKLLKPIKAYIKAIFIMNGKIFISLEGFLVPDIMIYKP